jgi:hypothetical protein
MDDLEAASSQVAGMRICRQRILTWIIVSGMADAVQDLG